MTAFVVMAAGEGRRVGRAGGKLHKALLPLQGRAVLSHLIDLAPDARVIICVGDRAQQIREYALEAHPLRDIEFVEVDIKKGWRGPGATLLAARDAVGDDNLILTTCDTLWTRDLRLWDGDDSWAGIAPTPAGTRPERWCRIERTPDDYAARLRDKEPGGPRNWAYTGLARIAAADLPAFWAGIDQTGSGRVDGELQVTGGLAALVEEDRLQTRRIGWTDVGDDQAYRAAVARLDGYDFTKLAEATYVLPEEGRVVKWWEDPLVAGRRRKRAALLEGTVPQLLGGKNGTLAYEYVPGRTGYAAVAQDGTEVTRRLLRWAEKKLWRPVPDTRAVVPTCLCFYHDKTMRRIALLSPELQRVAFDAVRDIDWTGLAARCVPCRIHGDFNLGNVVVTGDGLFLGIDWREDFGGALEWGDKRWDLGKLLAGTVVHWDRARRGDFRAWDEGQDHADVIRRHVVHAQALRDVEVIGALSLINSAPLHADPLPEILVARATAWLESLA